MLRLIAALLLGLATAAANADGLEGKPAPKLELRDASGARMALPDIAAGRPTVLLFWASWCPYCEALMPYLAELQRRHGDEVAVVAVSVWEEPEVDAPALLAARGYAFKALLKGDKSAKRWGVKGTPGLFVIGRDGVIVFDRNARPLKAEPAGPDQPVVVDRRQRAARSAELWAAAVEAAVTGALSAPAAGAGGMPAPQSR